MVISTSTQSQDRDYLKYFEGGREGFYERFGKALRESGPSVNGLEFLQLPKETGIARDSIVRASRGDLSQLSNEQIHRVAEIFKLPSIDKILGMPTIPEDDKHELYKEIRDGDGFMPVSGEASYDKIVLVNVFIRASNQL
ncbi:hypothetical protein HOD75_03195 [archaeon]|jgi:hypothetical protein|nr:hypothetical protein [archaeon]MBT4241879.1 hypothetical protein [archaeon]MBT4418426.1 hypothetical protein [archaeon]